MLEVAIWIPATNCSGSESTIRNLIELFCHLSINICIEKSHRGWKTISNAIKCTGSLVVYVCICVEISNWSRKCGPALRTEHLFLTLLLIDVLQISQPWNGHHWLSVTRFLILQDKSIPMQIKQCCVRLDFSGKSMRQPPFLTTKVWLCNIMTKKVLELSLVLME